VTKPIKDAIKTIGFSDDAQVTDLVVRKRWGEVEEVEVRFRELSEEEMLELGE
jgi:Holliday junction resolvase RusA-like endonuclease